MIDYLFHDDAIVSTALDVPHVDDNTPLPGPDQPSDHIALIAYFTWKEAR
jgi:hypothetical protein